MNAVPVHATHLENFRRTEPKSQLDSPLPESAMTLEEELDILFDDLEKETQMADELGIDEIFTEVLGDSNVSTISSLNGPISLSALQGEFILTL